MGLGSRLHDVNMVALWHAWLVIVYTYFYIFLYILLASFFNIDIKFVLADSETRADARKRQKCVECGFKSGGLHGTTTTARADIRKR